MSNASSSRKQTVTHAVRRRSGSYRSTEAKRKAGQKYYPDKSQAKTNRSETGKAAARARKIRGTQWRHGRKSKAQVRGS